jgi:hypothetical protein
MRMPVDSNENGFGGIPKGLRGHKKDHILFYTEVKNAPELDETFDELINALRNRGYVVERGPVYEESGDKLPSDLNYSKRYIVVETRVFTVDPELEELGPVGLHGLSSLSQSLDYNFRPYFKNSKIPVPKRRIKPGTLREMKIK